MHNMSSLPQWERLQRMGIEDWIAREKASGRVRRIGFSFHGSNSEFARLVDAYDWDFCQIQYNYMNEFDQAGRDGLEYAHSRGLAVIIMEPLLGGRLAVNLPKAAERIFRDADEQLGEQRSAAEWGLRWLWDQAGVTVVLSGMSTEEQLRDNLKSADRAAVGCLTEREREVYPRVTGVFREAYKVPCTGCNYCMPCPKGVNIPGSFAAYNMRYAVGFISGFQQYVTALGMSTAGRNASPRQCVKCGACQKKCPQSIPIPERLEEVSRKMEPIWMRAALKVVHAGIGGTKKDEE
jgi:predicted aldo/keto reductase-like oxidoreductase